MYRAIAHDAHILKDTQLRVSEAAPKPKQGQAPSNPTRSPIDECRIFVKGVPKEVSDQDISQHFGQFGRITNVYRARKENQQGQQFVFITYSSVQEMARALAEPEHNWGDVKFEVVKARARPQEDSRAHDPPPPPSFLPFMPSGPLVDPRTSAAHVLSEFLEGAQRGNKLAHDRTRQLPTPPLDFSTPTRYAKREDPYEGMDFSAAYAAFAQAQQAMPQMWGADAGRPSYKPDVRGKQQQRYAPY